MAMAAPGNGEGDAAPGNDEGVAAPVNGGRDAGLDGGVGSDEAPVNCASDAGLEQRKSEEQGVQEACASCSEG
ncbi:hypothetical protein CYMTET_53781 [Cymbomonas tetramitiformis]|uniref:Uncharacterized protein n=1 Tax=Cymbomonas tetramitiformis TaxID=36881 RepID=A0AAE0ERE3_9CHLO|nr:hypothetical protein CYMTET_53781 [Cymbomonas tetramitiformis]